MVSRYLTNFNLENVDRQYYDVVIIGTGIAGLYTALNIDTDYKVLLLTKDILNENNSNLAQGGIAACISPDDSFELHLSDTLKAGNFYNNEETTRILVYEAVKNIDKLLEFRTCFDRDESGNLLVTKEGGHSRKRILHAKDATGKEIIRSLSEEVKLRENIKVLQHLFAIDLLTSDDKCIGVLVKEKDKNEISAVFGKATVLATGGIGQIYNNTTNSRIATGDGIAMAYRAGAEIIDLEFIQFHPTALYSGKKERKFLISEAVRGEGAVLRNNNGELFMKKYHELTDLAPRDVVSKSMFLEMLSEEKSYVFLDITHKDKNFIKNRFPNIYNECLSLGLDMSEEMIPVCPVQHYVMGGIKTDTYGRSNLQGLYSCGENACTQVHGANRLASNSLLEGLVFGKRIAEDINNNIKYVKNIYNNIEVEIMYESEEKFELQDIKNKIKEIMSKYVFILRSKEGLQTALESIKEIITVLEKYYENTTEFYECMNMATVSYIIIISALKREKSLGSHNIIKSLEVKNIAK